MKKQIMTRLLFIVATFIIGCRTDTTAPADQSQLTVVSSITSPSVSGIIPKYHYSIASGGAACDSVQVTSARFLFSNLKVHIASSDTINDGTLQAGAFVGAFNSGKEQIIASGYIPAGTYDHYKFEMHQYNPSIDIGLNTGLLFADFTTAAHNTLVIQGNVYSGGIAYPFVYSSRVVSNEEVDFFPQTFEGGKTYHISIDFLPSTAFSTNGYTMDPRDPNNADMIDAGIKASFRSYAAISNL